MQSSAPTPEAYLSELPPERQGPMRKLREAIQAHIDPAFQEGMGYGMMGWDVPFSIYPEGYHCNPKLPVPFLGLASQKNYIAVYHMGVYNDPALLKWFQDEYAKTGWKLNMGKSCIRLRRMDQIPYELIGKLASKPSLKEYLHHYVTQVKR